MRLRAGARALRAIELATRPVQPDAKAALDRRWSELPQGTRGVWRNEWRNGRTFLSGRLADRAVWRGGTARLLRKSLTRIARQGWA